MILQLTCAIVEIALYAALAAAALHLAVAAAWALRRGRTRATAASTPAELPVVTVQLPVRDEAPMIEALLGAAAALDWPRDRLELQVLDDSDDETSAIVDRVAAGLAAAGTPIVVLRRADRRGYKAGNLAHGLSHARGELILVLDADFRPAPDLLRALHAALAADPSLAFAQARWSYRNREASPLTRLQAAILDGLFTVEQARLSARGAPVQFNGSGGLWRRAAIDRAGGWRVDEHALTEDLDLSFRAHELGLRGATLPDVVVATELPATMAAFRTQQARWVRGGALALRALGRRLIGRSAGSDARTMLAHLARHLRQPLFVAAALRLAVVACGAARPVAPAAVGPAVFAALAAAAALYLGAATQRTTGRLREGVLLSPLLLLLSVGIAPALALAFVGGLLGRRGGGFQRTEKIGDIARRPSPARLDLASILGLLVAAAAGASFLAFAYARDPLGAAAALAVMTGCAWVAL